MSGKPNTLDDIVRELKLVNAAIARMESELAKRASDLLTVYEKHQAELGTLYEQRRNLDDAALDALKDEAGSRIQSMELAALEKRLSLMRFR